MTYTTVGEIRSSVDLKPTIKLLKELGIYSQKIKDLQSSKPIENIEELGIKLSSIIKILDDLISKDLEELSEKYNKNLKEVIVELQDTLNFLITEFSFFSKSLSFQSNFDGYIAEVTFKAGQELKIQHFLGFTPKWRVILKQEGNGVLSDIPSKWNNDFITLKNNGAVSVTASILIARE